MADYWSKYLRRPDILKQMCFAQFARMYKSHSSLKAQEEEDGDLEDQCADSDALLEAVAQAEPEEKDNEDEDESKFHYVMTYHDKLS